MYDYKHKGLGCIVSIIVLFILGALFSQSIDDDINENGKYTLGITINIARGASTKKLINYNYQIQNKDYGWYIKYTDDIKVPNGKYLVKFSCKNLDRSRLLSEYRLPDTLDYSDVPAEGWDSIPEFVIQYNKK